MARMFPGNPSLLSLLHFFLRWRLKCSSIQCTWSSAEIVSALMRQQGRLAVSFVADAVGKTQFEGQNRQHCEIPSDDMLFGDRRDAARVCREGRKQMEAAALDFWHH